MALFQKCFYYLEDSQWISKFKAQLEKMVSDFEDSELAHDAQLALDRPDEASSTTGRGFKKEVESE